MRGSRSHRVYLLCNCSTKDKKDLETTNIRTPLSEADICPKKEKKVKVGLAQCWYFHLSLPRMHRWAPGRAPASARTGVCVCGGGWLAPRSEDPCRASVSADLVRVTKLLRGDTESTSAQTDYPSALWCEGEGRWCRRKGTDVLGEISPILEGLLDKSRGAD